MELVFLYGLEKYNVGLEETPVTILFASAAVFFQSVFGLYTAEDGNDSYRKQRINTKFCVKLNRHTGHKISKRTITVWTDGDEEVFLTDTKA